MHQSVRVTKSVRWFAAACLLSSLPGCGAGNESTDAPSTSSATQAFDELNCMFTAPNYNCGSLDCDKGSPGANYGTSTCTNAFIVQRTYPTASYVETFYDWRQGAPIPDRVVYPCEATWLRTRILKWSGTTPGTWQQYSDTTVYGAVAPQSYLCDAPMAFTNVTAGTYKIFAQAGFIYTYEPVHIVAGGASPPPPR